MDTTDALAVEHLPLDALAPYAANAKQHPPEQIDALCKSITEYGWTRPILLDSTGNIIVGHGAFLAAQQLKRATVPTIRLEHLTPEQARAYRIADNRLTELGSWDMTNLQAELDALDLAGFDLELTGFDQAALDELGLDGDDADTGEEDETPEPPQEPTTQPGDVWVMGDHRLICGDSTDKGTVERLLDGATPNIMVTDPPYGVDYDPEWRIKNAIGPSSVIRTMDVVATGKVASDDKSDWSDSYKLFPGDVVYVWSPIQKDFYNTIIKAGFVVRYQLIWVKPSAPLGRGHYNIRHEACWYAVRDSATAHWIGDQKQNTVWEIAGLNPMGRSKDSDDSMSGHSTQKPLECMERPIRNHSGDVYDPFCGSGTTLIAAERQGRRCWAVELMPQFCDVIVERWQNLTGGRALRETS